MFVDTDLKIDKPQTVVEIDRDKPAQLGLTMRDVGSSLGCHAWRRLCQLLQPVRTLVQGDSAGDAKLNGSLPTN